MARGLSGIKPRSRTVVELADNLLFYARSGPPPVAEDKARAVLESLLEKYADSGIASVEALEILKVDPLTAHGTPVEIVNLFGGKSGYLKAISELESALYRSAA